MGLLLQTLAAQAVADMRAGTLTPANVTGTTGAPALSSFLAQIDLPSTPPCAPAAWVHRADFWLGLSLRRRIPGARRSKTVELSDVCSACVSHCGPPTDERRPLCAHRAPPPPSPSPPSPPAPPGVLVFSGVAYDGYLTACIVRPPPPSPALGLDSPAQCAILLLPAFGRKGN